jgi:hypothetical protein
MLEAKFPSKADAMARGGQGPVRSEAKPMAVQLAAVRVEYDDPRLAVRIAEDLVDYRQVAWSGR